MAETVIVNILDLIDSIGEEEVQTILSGFSCSKNKEIENFVRKNAVIFAKKKMSVTYLVFDRNGNLSSIFTLAHKALVGSCPEPQEENLKDFRNMTKPETVLQYPRF